MIDRALIDADDLDRLEDARLRGMRGPPSLAFRVELEGRTVRLVVDALNDEETAKLRFYVRPLASEILLAAADVLDSWCAVDA